MNQYIDKDALIAEIEKAIKSIYAGREYVGIPSNEENIVRGLQKAEDIIDTFEVKKVDLDEEFKKYCFNFKDPLTGKSIKEGECIFTVEQALKLANHFFELGLKTKDK